MKFLIIFLLLINVANAKYIVKFKDSSKLNKNNLEKIADNTYLVNEINNIDASNVEYIEPDYEINIYTYDQLYKVQWGLENRGNNDPKGRKGVEGADINALKAWKYYGKGSKNVKIAVIDTGVDYKHPDLKNNIWVNEAELNGKEGVDDDGNGYVDDIHGYDFSNNDGDPLDDNGHGTHCAGIIGASHNNAGVAGVLSNTSIVPVKFLSGSGSGSTSGAIKAIDYGIKIGVDIMSNSWGGGSRSIALKEAITRAYKADIIFVAAAGNSGSNNDVKPHYPSNYQVENVISVAAHNNADELASFSCYGQTVHIASPGRNIMSTYPDNRYKSLSGTSMATPFVSGALGLLLSNENLSISDMKSRLMKTSTPIDAYTHKIKMGGRLNLYNLLSNIQPVRNLPSNKWKAKSISFESEHPYSNNSTIEKTFSIDGAEYVKLSFERVELEQNYDYIEVYSEKSKIEKITGRHNSYVTRWIRGDSIRIKFISDRSKTFWGFRTNKILYQ